MIVKIQHYYDLYNKSYFNLTLPNNAKIKLNDEGGRGEWTAYKSNEAKNDIVSISHEAREKIKFSGP